jgi:succinate dehydrogenase / fumarate reductase cytochrome b subunit
MSHPLLSAACSQRDTVPCVATATLVKDSKSTRSTIALKILMAVSGIVFIGFVLAHMYGNLKAFAGHDAYNEYAEHLRELGEPMLPHAGFLWILRVVLIGSLVVHVAAALALWRRAKRARRVKYVMKKNNHSTWASHLMRWGGLTLLLFIVWHLLNFTIGKVNVQNPGETSDPYNLLVDSFDVWWLTLIYLFAMAMLGAHLHHGIWSSMQTLGLTNTEGSRTRAKQVGFVLAVIITGGFSLVPIFVLAGVITK